MDVPGRSCRLWAGRLLALLCLPLLVPISGPGTGCATQRAAMALRRGRYQRALAILDGAHEAAPGIRARALAGLGDYSSALRWARRAFETKRRPSDGMLASRMAWRAGRVLTAMALAERAAALGLLDRTSQKWLRTVRTAGAGLLARAGWPVAASFALKRAYECGGRLPDRLVRRILRRAVLALLEHGRPEVARRLVQAKYWKRKVPALLQLLASLGSCTTHPKRRRCLHLLDRLCQSKISWASGRVAAATAGVLRGRVQEGSIRPLLECGLRGARASRDMAVVRRLQRLLGRRAPLPWLEAECRGSPDWSYPACSLLASRVASAPSATGCDLLVRAARWHGWWNLEMADRLARTQACARGQWRALLGWVSPHGEGTPRSLLVRAELALRSGRVQSALLTWEGLATRFRTNPVFRLELARSALGVGALETAESHLNWAPALGLDQRHRAWRQELSRTLLRLRAGRKGYVEAWVARLLAHPEATEQSFAWILQAAGPPVLLAVLRRLGSAGGSSGFPSSLLGRWLSIARQRLDGWLAVLPREDRLLVPGGLVSWWYGFGRIVASELETAMASARAPRPALEACGLSQLYQVSGPEDWASAARSLLARHPRCRLGRHQRLDLAAGMLALSGHVEEAGRLLRAEVDQPDLRQAAWALERLGALPIRDADADFAWLVADTLPFATALVRPCVAILLRARKWGRARLASRALVTWTPDPVGALVYLTRLWLTAHRCEEAGDFLARLMEWTGSARSPEVDRLHAELVAQCRPSTFDLASAGLGRPGTGRRSRVWARVLAEAGRQEEALESAWDDPGTRIAVWLRFGALEQARRAAARWHRAEPLRADPVCALANVATRRQDWAAAEGLLEHAWQIEPTNPCIRSEWIHLARHRGETIAARQWAAARSGTSARLTLWRLAQRAGDWHAMGRALAALLANEPQRAIRAVWEGMDSRRSHGRRRQ